MNYWSVEYTDEAAKDRSELDASLRILVDKAIRKVSLNPLPNNEGGYGIPLGNKPGKNLAGFCKIKLKKPGIRVVYKIVRDGDIMKIIVIAARSDDEVYEIAAKRSVSE